MDIVTKNGDNGFTSLYGGERVNKDNVRVNAYGTIDELSSVIGLLITYCSDKSDIYFLTQIQRDLFTVGGYLATDSSTTELNEHCILNVSSVTYLEEKIKDLEETLPPLRCFILPGGSRASAVCHICRTVCRRAERCIVSLCNTQSSANDSAVLKYINRLSDYFFVLARKLNMDLGIVDTVL